MPFAATWMDLEIIILSEISQAEKDITWYLLYVQSLVDNLVVFKTFKKYFNWNIVDYS